MSKHVPIRTCVICGTKKEKKELFKIIKTEEGNLFDRKQHLDGRGFYLCRKPECIKKGTKHRRWQIDAVVYESLVKELETGNQLLV